MSSQIDQRIARLEALIDESLARLVVSEGLLAAIVRHHPETNAIIDDFVLHQDYLEATILHSCLTSDFWIAKLQEAREAMQFRLETDYPDPSTRKSQPDQ